VEYQQVGDRISFGNARFSALNNGLVRLEWSVTGEFEDRCTVQVFTRPNPVAFKAIAFSDGVLRLDTEYIQIAYKPNSEQFNDTNLQIKWQCSKFSGSWTPASVDYDNLGGTLSSLDLLHRNFKPTGVHPASVEASYPDTEEWIYKPLKQAHRILRDRGEKTEFEDPPLWYWANFCPEEFPPNIQEFWKQWQKFPPGILSKSGYYVLNDSDSAAIENGCLSDRTSGDITENQPKINPNLTSQDWYFFAYGLDYAQALQDFVKLCGRIPMLPRWAYGVWFSLFGRLDESDYQQLVKQFDEQNLPLSVLILDVDWHGAGWCGWDWNTELFPNPPAFLEWGHSLGLRFGANVHTEGLSPRDSKFEALCQARGLNPADVKAGKVFAIKNPTSDWIFHSWQPDGSGSFQATAEEMNEGWLLFNLADQEQASLFMQALHTPREQDGIDFWWIDGTNAIHEGVNSQLWTNHVYYTHSQAKDNRRAMILSRTGGIGSHRYPLQFSADTYSHWEVLEFLVNFTAQAGNVGVAYWSHDLGGFYNHLLGAPTIDPELFVRWIQFGCWSPIVRLHSDHGVREPWAYGRRVLQAIRTAFHTRMEFIPYFYHLSRVAYDTGLPICRPLYLGYADDPQAYQTPTEFLLGDRILVAPVVEAGCYRKVYLPSGVWWERATNKYYPGNQQLNLYVPLDQVPIFIKAGAILPLQPVTLRVETSPPTCLILEVYAGEEGELDLYEDDGESIAYRTNAGSRRLFTQTCDRENYILTCAPVRGSYPGMPEQRKFQIRWIGLVPDSQVEAIGVQLSDWRWVGEVLEVSIEAVPQTASWRLVVGAGLGNN
jgi:alpha-glucosidase (family GH31 glycosyl hydrolase)